MNSCLYTPSPTAQSDFAAVIERRMKIEIRDIGIPPRPCILAQIEQETAKDEPDFIHLGKLLSQDVGLAAGMIKIANSPYFSFGRKVPTVQEALLVLGLKLVMKSLAGLALRQAFKHVPDMEEFWATAADMAEVSGRIAFHLGTDIRPEDAHTFALFRDCGIPMLLIPFPEYRAVLDQAAIEESLTFTELEDRALCINHAMVGAELAEDWLLPEETCLAIRHHHDPAVLLGTTDLPARAQNLIAIALLAEHLIHLKHGGAPTAEWSKLGGHCLERLGLRPENLPELLRSCAH